VAEIEVELARRNLEAFNAGDLDAFAEMCHPDVEIVPIRAAIEDTRYRGLEGVRQFFADTAEVWEELQIDIDEITQIPRGVLILFHLVGRSRLGGVPLDALAGGVMEFREGKITRIETFRKREDALRAAESDVRD
jgi:ketosteroid isomerase-like protein